MMIIFAKPFLLVCFLELLNQLLTIIPAPGLPCSRWRARTPHASAEAWGSDKLPVPVDGVSYTKVSVFAQLRYAATGF